MNDETYEALKRVMSGRYGKNSLQYKSDVKQVKGWIDETAKEHPEEDQS